MWIGSKTYGYLINLDQIRIIKLVYYRDCWMLKGITQSNDDIIIEKFESENKATEFLKRLYIDLEVKQK